MFLSTVCPEPEITHDFEGDPSDTPDLDINLDPITDKRSSMSNQEDEKWQSGQFRPHPTRVAEACRVNHPCLANLLNTVWQKQEVLTNWRDGIIIPLPKKGDLSDCDNWRGITLLSVPGKVFANIVLSRLRDGVEMYLQTEQTGFRPGRSCNDQIFTLRQIIEKESNSVAETSDDKLHRLSKGL